MFDITVTFVNLVLKISCLTNAAFVKCEISQEPSPCTLNIFTSKKKVVTKLRYNCHLEYVMLELENEGLHNLLPLEKSFLEMNPNNLMIMIYYFAKTVWNRATWNRNFISRSLLLVPCIVVSFNTCQIFNHKKLGEKLLVNYPNGAFRFNCITSFHYISPLIMTGEHKHLS